MKHIKIFENFVLESGYAEKIKDLGQRAVDMANKKAALSAKVRELTANAEKPKDVGRAEIGRLQLQILELDRQKLQLSKRLADFWTRTADGVMSLQYNLRMYDKTARCITTAACCCRTSALRTTAALQLLCTRTVTARSLR